MVGDRARASRYDQLVANDRADGRRKRGKLHNLIFVGIGVGLLLGYLLHVQKDAHPVVFDRMMFWLDLFGPTLFIGALKMIIAPLILASIVTGVTGLPNLQELGSIGWKAIAYYFCTTTIAVVIANGVRGSFKA